MFFSTDGDKPPPRIVGVRLKESNRSFDTDPLLQSDHDPLDPDSQKYKKVSHKFPTWSALVVLGYCLAVLGIVYWSDHRLPQALTIQDGIANPDRFIEERARIFLKKLTSVGPRPAGSYENEVLAVDLIKQQLNAIKAKAKPVHKLTIDVQKPRGSFNLKFIDGLTQHYRNIQNVIVKLESVKGSKEALLLNCHFDSVPASPGASDDAVSCAIMLEILEVLVTSPDMLDKNIIFLFNGAEENMLPASHGFITQHEWASEIKAFINLEACGAGGREVVFQSGPNHPWLIEAYGKVAPYPFASVIGQEIFQSGVIPADTDFRIFRDYGKIPGLDIAYVKNGYVYHTKYDTEDRIPKGSVQRAGDNLLALVKYIVNSELLSHTDQEFAKSGHNVFFDLLGFFLVHYPEWVGVVLNLSTVFLSTLFTIKKYQQSHRVGISRSTYRKQVGLCLWYQFIGVLASFFVVIIIATFLDALGKSMTWYARPYLIFFLYVCPTLFSVAAVFNFALPRHKKDFNFAGGNWAIESLYFEVNRSVWTLFTFLMTLLRIQSAYFCMIWVIFPLAGRYVLERVLERSLDKNTQRDWRWLMVHLGSQLLPLILGLTMIYNTHVMFIPIMGRSGSALNPDLLIGCQTVIMVLAVISYLAPLFLVIKKPNHIIVTLYTTTLAAMLLVCVTRLGFPYSGSPTNLAPQRALIFHTDREFYNKDLTQRHSDSGYFFINLDRNSPRQLINHVPELSAMEEVTDEQCDEMLFCGIPLYYPCSTMLRVNNWIPAKKPRLYRNTSIELLSSQKSGMNKVKLLFRLQGPDHMGIYFSPKKGITVSDWSFVEHDVINGPEWKDGRATHFIFYSHGIAPSPWEFWLELQTPKTHLEGQDYLDLAIAGHFIHGNEMMSPHFKQFLNQFPTWSYPVGWSVSYKAHVF